MKLISALILLLTFGAKSALAQEGNPMSTQTHFGAVSPALVRYESTTLTQLWNRPGLSVRDRSIVTVSALITRNTPAPLAAEMTRALDNGVRACELSEIITHLAFYTGWGNAIMASGAAQVVFTERGIKTDILPAASPQLLPLDETVEAARAASVSQQFADVSPGVVQYTGDVLFKELWLRPALGPRDRSLVTVAALVTSGQVAQMTYHLGRAMDNGLTRDQAGEALTQLAFYAGWPNVFSALPVVKDVFEKRMR